MSGPEAPRGDPATATAATAAPTTATAAAVDAAIAGRYSCRAFLPTPVDRTTIEEILDVAARAPSGTNTQPWQVTVLTGDALRRLTDRVVAAYDDPDERARHREEYAYYPTEWRSPYVDRRRTVGYDLYGLLGIGRGDQDRIHAQHRRNFRFFDAPVGLVFTIDRTLGLGSFLDYGMFLQNVMVAARARGLDTCPQAAWNTWHRLIAEELDLPAQQQVVCGMALGHGDPSAVENTLQTVREPARSFTRFLD